MAPWEDRGMRTSERKPVDRQQVPAIMRRALYAVILIGAVASVPAIGGYSPVPVGALLDAWIALFVVICIVRGRIATSLTLGLLLLYSLSRIIPALYTETPIADFAQAYKWLLYLLAFVVAVGRTWGALRPMVRVMMMLLGLSLAKAVLTVATSGQGARSGLLTENNFEIALFAGLIGVTYRTMSAPLKLASVVLLGAITALSGSRSGAVAFVILAVFVVFQATQMNLFLRYLLVLALPAVVWYVTSIFASRAEQLGGVVDRINFLNVFLAETAAWDPLTWLFGAMPLTPLSNEGCGALSYYQSLFASAADGTCFSVVLHAFTMRIIFDAGIIGLLIAFGVALYAMRKAGVSKSLTFTLLLIAFTNGLSVSGLNNAYVALPILIAITTANAVGLAPSEKSKKSKKSRPTKSSRYPAITGVASR
jgi:hypothetical protein